MANITLNYWKSILLCCTKTVDNSGSTVYPACAKEATVLERWRRIDFQQTSHFIWVKVDVFGTFDTAYFAL